MCADPPLRRSKPGKQDEWTATVLGLNKRDLLKEVLGVLAKNRNTAALATEYLDTLKKMSAV